MIAKSVIADLCIYRVVQSKLKSYLVLVNICNNRISSVGKCACLCSYYELLLSFSAFIRVLVPNMLVVVYYIY
ncbi:MAG: hypothetical protein ACRD8W_32805, partial [Nitrososphaeraceae archaeon]